MEISNKLNNTLLFEAERNVFGNNVHNYGEVNDQDKMKDLILHWCINSKPENGDSIWNDYITQYEYSNNIKQRIFEWSVTNQDLYYYHAWDYDKNVIAYDRVGNRYNNLSLYKNNIHKSVFTLLNNGYDIYLETPLVSWRLINNNNKIKLLQEYYFDRFKS